MAKIDAFDHPTREPNYRLANMEVPWARAAERLLMLALTNPRPGEQIIDLGCGAGTLSIPLGRAVSPGGSVLAFDGSLQMIQGLAGKAEQYCLPVTAAKLDEEQLPLFDTSVDAVVSLAAFHHFADWDRYFGEAARVLRPGGRLVVGDVASGSRPARYFNGPIHYQCSTGHRFPYTYKEALVLMCRRTSLVVDFCALVDVPWCFHDEAEAAWFLNTIHDAQCPPAESLETAKQYLGWQTVPGDEYPFRINWQLLFMRAAKPR